MAPARLHLSADVQEHRRALSAGEKGCRGGPVEEALRGQGLCEHDCLTRAEGLTALPSSLTTWDWAPAWQCVLDLYYHRMEMASFCFLEPHKSEGKIHFYASNIFIPGEMDGLRTKAGAAVERRCS